MATRKARTTVAPVATTATPAPAEKPVYPNFFVNLGKGLNDPLTTEGTSTKFEINGIPALLEIHPESLVAYAYAVKGDVRSSRPFASGKVIRNPMGQRLGRKDADFVLVLSTAKGSEFKYLLWDHGNCYTGCMTDAAIRLGAKLQAA